MSMAQTLEAEISPKNKLCSECSAILVCGSASEVESCWCFAYPAAMAVDLQQDCLCAECLGKAIQNKIADLIHTSSQQEVIAVARKYRGNDKLIHHIDYSIENNNYVFTAWYHLKRGSCCGNGCKNCPY